MFHPHPCCRGDRVEVRLERGELAASVDSGKNVGPSQSIALSSGGSLTVFANKPGTNRRVDIVKPGVEIRVVQPWIGGASGYAQR